MKNKSLKFKENLENLEEQAYVLFFFLYNFSRMEPFIVSQKVTLINCHLLTGKFLMVTCASQVTNTVWILLPFILPKIGSMYVNFILDKAPDLAAQ